MRYWVYILQSKNTERFYCGHTNNLERRISQHNNPEYTFTRTTKILKGPWKIIWSRKCPSRGDAMQLEHSIKKRGIARYLSNAQSAESRQRRD